MRTASRKPGELKGLADMDGGIISREIFVSQEIDRHELEPVFTRPWLSVGYESQVPRCRNRAGCIHVLPDSCRHRGMKV